MGKYRALGTRSARVVARACCLLAVWVLTALAHADAQTQSVILAWDPSPDASVIGYVVYVGTERDSPAETFRVNGTSFVYPNPASDHPYFFSVAAFSSDQRTGNRSEEVMFLGRASSALTSPLTIGAARGDGAPSPSIPSRPIADQVCLGPADSDCYATVGTIGDFGRIDSLRALGDGRLTFIENGTRVLIVSPDDGVGMASVAHAAQGTRLLSLAVDPHFVATHFVYVAESESLADGLGEVSVVRYRELGGVFGERAVLISGLPSSPEGTARIALDGYDHLFVALPQIGLEAGATRDSDSPYAGMVLRFQTDGRIPADNRAASAMFAWGVAEPGLLEWEPLRNSLWIADAHSDRALERIELGREHAEWPLSADAVKVQDADVNASTHVVALSFDASNATAPLLAFVAGDDRTTVRVLRGNSVAEFSPAAASWPSVDAQPIGAAFSKDELNVAVAATRVDGQVVSRIVRLKRRVAGR